jgi:hypothetical protein
MTELLSINGAPPTGELGLAILCSEHDQLKIVVNQVRGD